MAALSYLLFSDISQRLFLEELEMVLLAVAGDDADEVAAGGELGNFKLGDIGECSYQPSCDV